MNKDKSKKNIVILFPDQLRHDFLGCYGAEFIKTPNIDSLSNGLTVVAEKFKNEYIAGHVQLKKGERTYLSAVAAQIL